MSSDDDDFNSDAEVGNESPVVKKPGRMLFAVNNIAGLNDKLEEIKVNLSWIEKFDITVDTSNISEASDPVMEMQSVQPDTTAENDFKREMIFYNQARIASQEAVKRLTKLKIPIRRPTDYFAEMAKSDVHMVKVREKLLSKQISIERSEKARELREQRKQGKKIQQEVLKKRQSEKKVLMEALKKSKKGKMIDTAELLQEKKKQNSMQPQKNKGPKDRHKDEKYGYGGKKKGSKYNTAESSAYFNKNKRNSSFNRKKGGPGKKQGKRFKKR